MQGHGGLLLFRNTFFSKKSILNNKGKYELFLFLLFYLIHFCPILLIASLYWQNTWCVSTYICEKEPYYAQIYILCSLSFENQKQKTAFAGFIYTPTIDK